MKCENNLWKPAPALAGDNWKIKSCNHNLPIEIYIQEYTNLSSLRLFYK